MIGSSLSEALKDVRSAKQERTKAKRLAAWRCFKNDPELSVSRIAERLGVSTSEVTRFRREYESGAQP